LITLTFRRIDSKPPRLVRGTYFRICADGTLRGPDNSITASYADGFWRIAHRRHRAVDCDGPVYLRITGSDGCRQNSGPYESVRAADGAIFTHDNCLGAHASGLNPQVRPGLWREIVLLSAMPPEHLSPQLVLTRTSTVRAS
jgi:hypothetical protein